MDNMIGEILAGRYQITELIDVDDLSDTYKATDKMLNTSIKVKLYNKVEIARSTLNEYSGFITRRASLHHPNNIRVY